MNVSVRAFLGLLLMVLPGECLAADLTIMAEDAAPPFSRADGTGYANDVVKAAFRAAGVDVALDVVPYARCKRDVADGKVPACFGMSWYKGVEEVVTFSQQPVFEVYADVFVAKKSAARLSRMTDFGRGTTIGIVNEYEYPDEVSGFPRNGAALQTSANDGANLKMLARGRLDAAIVMTNDLVPQTQKATEAGVAGDVAFAFRSGVEKSYVGFSKKNPRGELARQQFDAGYKKILADGTIAAIRKKWLSAR